MKPRYNDHWEMATYINKPSPHTWYEGLFAAGLIVAVVFMVVP